MNESNENVEVMKSFMNTDFQEMYLNFHGKKVHMKLCAMEDSIEPFVENKNVFTELKLHGIKSLPILMINNELVAKEHVDLVKILPKYLEMGLSIQYEEE